MHYMRNALQHVNLNVIDGQLILYCTMFDAWTWRVVFRRRIWSIRADPELCVLTFPSTCRIHSASGQRGDLRLSVVYGGSQDVFTALCNETH